MNRDANAQKRRSGPWMFFYESNLKNAEKSSRGAGFVLHCFPNDLFHGMKSGRGAPPISSTYLPPRSIGPLICISPRILRSSHVTPAENVCFPVAVADCFTCVGRGECVRRSFFRCGHFFAFRSLLGTPWPIRR